MLVKPRVTGRYEYRDASGNLLYWKERLEPGRNGERKEFCFYHGMGERGRGGESVLYNLPIVIASKAVIITEGEKQADLLKTWGLCATSLDSGAGSKLLPSMICVLTGKRIAILQDNDEPGTMYALKLAKGLQGKFESLRIVLLPDLPDKGDIMDWNGDRAQLLEIIKATPEWLPPPEEPKKERRQINRNIKGAITSEMIESAAQYPIENLVEFVNGKALCFNHPEKTPSLSHCKSINKCRCFGGCDKTWDSIDVLVSRDGLSFADAVKQLSSITQ